MIIMLSVVVPNEVSVNSLLFLFCTNVQETMTAPWSPSLWTSFTLAVSFEGVQKSDSIIFSHTIVIVPVHCNVNV